MNAPLPAQPQTITVPLGEAQLIVPVPMLVRTFLKQYAIDAECHARIAGRHTEGPPRIGELWYDHGGIYAGVARGRDGKPDYHLIVAQEDRVEITWADAVKWAEGIDIDGDSDFTLPRRHEQAILFGNVPESSSCRSYYWSSEQYESVPSYAWAQSFYYGDQNGHHKSAQLRARRSAARCASPCREITE